MVFWSRLRQSGLQFRAFSNGFNRFFTQIPAPIVANQHFSSRSLVPISNNPKFIVLDTQLEFFRQFRFFASRFKPNQKKETKDTASGPRINEEITAPMVRLVDDEDHCVISRYEAMARANSLELDLVEVDRSANPPVCKIFDYNKLKYIQQTKDKERAKNKATLKTGPCKEVRFAGKIKQNDLRIKADMAKRLMESGYRVKCTATDATADMDLKTLLSRFTALIDDVAVMEGAPKYEKKQAFVVVRHVKFGPSKKGSGKKASKDAVSSQNVDFEENSDEDVQTNKSEWAVFDGDEGMRSIFDINNEENGPSKSSKHEQSAFATGPPPHSMGRNPRHAVEPAPSIATSSIPSGNSKPATENRYARDPTSAKPPRIPSDMNGRGARNTMNSVPQMPNQGNMSPRVRPSQQVEVPACEVPSQDSSRSSNPNSPAKSYGIFSTPQVNTPPHEQDAPAATNRYMKNGPSDSATSPRTPGPSTQRDSPTADSRMNAPTQGRWGLFSTDNSRVVPNKNENRAEVQRR